MSPTDDETRFIDVWNEPDPEFHSEPESRVAYGQPPVLPVVTDDEKNDQ